MTNREKLAQDYDNEQGMKNIWIILAITVVAFIAWLLFKHHCIETLGLVLLIAGVTVIVTWKKVSKKGIVIMSILMAIVILLCGIWQAFPWCKEIPKAVKNESSISFDITYGDGTQIPNSEVKSADAIKSVNTSLNVSPELRAVWKLIGTKANGVEEIHNNYDTKAFVVKDNFSEDVEQITFVLQYVNAENKSVGTPAEKSVAIDWGKPGTTPVKAKAPVSGKVVTYKAPSNNGGGSGQVTNEPTSVPSSQPTANQPTNTPNSQPTTNQPTNTPNVINGNDLVIRFDVKPVSGSQFRSGTKVYGLDQSIVTRGVRNKMWIFESNNGSNSNTGGNWTIPYGVSNIKVTLTITDNNGNTRSLTQQYDVIRSSGGGGGGHYSTPSGSSTEVDAPAAPAQNPGAGSGNGDSQVPGQGNTTVPVPSSTKDPNSSQSGGSNYTPPTPIKDADIKPENNQNPEPPIFNGYQVPQSQTNNNTIPSSQPATTNGSGESQSPGSKTNSGSLEIDAL